MTIDFTFALAIKLLLILLLLVVVTTDVRTRTISNRLNAAIAVLAVAWWWAAGLDLWPDIGVRVIGAVVVFALFAGVFALGMMGGGDVKLLTALALWLAPVPLTRMLVLMSILGGGLTLAMLGLHRLRRREGNPEIPYGVAIAGSALAIITHDILTILPR